MGFLDSMKAFAENISEKTEKIIRDKLRDMTDDQLRQQYQKIMNGSSSQKSIEMIESEMKRRGLL